MSKIKSEITSDKLSKLFDESVQVVADTGMPKDVSFNLLSEEEQNELNETFKGAGTLFASYVKEVFFHKIVELVIKEEK